MKRPFSNVEKSASVSLSRHLDSGAEQALSLAEICRRALEPRLARMLRQGIQWEVDADDCLSTSFDAGDTTLILGQLIDDACDVMPTGGSLEITAVVVGEIVEIEVADSRSYDLRAQDFDKELVALLVANRDQGIRLVEADCPQGGLARTIVIGFAKFHSATVAPFTTSVRRAA